VQRVFEFLRDRLTIRESHMRRAANRAAQTLRFDLERNSESLGRTAHQLERIMISGTVGGEKSVREMRTDRSKEKRGYVNVSMIADDGDETFGILLPIGGVGDREQIPLEPESPVLKVTLDRKFRRGQHTEYKLSQTDHAAQYDPNLVVGDYIRADGLYKLETDEGRVTADIQSIGLVRGKYEGRIVFDFVPAGTAHEWSRYVMAVQCRMTKDALLAAMHFGVSWIFLTRSRATNSRRYFDVDGEAIQTPDGLHYLTDRESRHVSNMNTWIGMSWNAFYDGRTFSLEGTRPIIASRNRSLLEYGQSDMDERAMEGELFLKIIADNTDMSVSETAASLKVLMNARMVEGPGREPVIINFDDPGSQGYYLQILGSMYRTPNSKIQTVLEATPEIATDKFEAGAYMTPSTAAICCVPPILTPTKGDLHFTVWSLGRNNLTYLASSVSEYDLVRVTAHLNYNELSLPVKGIFLRRFLGAVWPTMDVPTKKNRWIVITKYGNFDYAPLIGRFVTTMKLGERSMFRAHDMCVYAYKDWSGDVRVTATPNVRNSSMIGPNKKISYLSRVYYGLYSREHLCGLTPYMTAAVGL
jgi:hypothetical protein